MYSEFSVVYLRLMLILVYVNYDKHAVGSLRTCTTGLFVGCCADLLK